MLFAEASIRRVALRRCLPAIVDGEFHFLPRADISERTAAAAFARGWTRRERLKLVVAVVSGSDTPSHRWTAFATAAEDGQETLLRMPAWPEAGPPRVAFAPQPARVM